MGVGIRGWVFMMMTTASYCFAEVPKCATILATVPMTQNLREKMQRQQFFTITLMMHVQWKSAEARSRFLSQLQKHGLEKLDEWAQAGPTDWVKVKGLTLNFIELFAAIPNGTTILYAGPRVGKVRSKT